MKKYLFALCALGALACAQEAKNGASIGVGAAVQKGVFYTKDRLSAVPLPQIEAYYEGFYVRGLEVGYEHNFSENLFAGAYARFFDGWRVKSSKLKPQYRSVRDREHQTALGGKFGANLGGFRPSFTPRAAEGAVATGPRRRISYLSRRDFRSPRPLLTTYFRESLAIITSART